ncbi:restriction endonuclease subunit S [Bilifractor porci]|uniref:Restriction endonuclease n=1 Tax=Bilifractor porci TaxID=2606636 RepID=A0A7X2P7N0_9FIRM|nr:restriction endonuclease subunit S [Bilifractor porci]MST81750.1 restriction endonuclease [Bilifractor porci]
MEYTKIKNINEYVSESVSPMNTPEQIFEMYSVPIYSTGHPEYLHGNEIASNKVKVRKNDVLLCKINPRINRVWIVADESAYPCIASSEWIVIRNSEYNPEFLAWYFRSPKFKQLMTSEVTGIGGSLTRAQPKAVAEYPVPVIERQEQDVITEILNKIYNIIDARRREINILDDLIKARFVEMFGSYPENEKGWETGTIRDLVTDVRYGSSRKAAEGNQGKYRYLRMNNITYSGELDLTDVKTIDIPDQELDKCAVRKGDLLFNRTNSKELVGKTCVYDRDEQMVLAGFVIRVRLNDRALPEFVSAFLNTDFSKAMLLAKCKTAVGQANINAQEFQNIGIYVPPIEFQKEFVSFKKQVNKSKVAAQIFIEEAEKI